MRWYLIALCVLASLSIVGCQKKSSSRGIAAPPPPPGGENVSATTAPAPVIEPQTGAASSPRNANPGIVEGAWDYSPATTSARGGAATTNQPLDGYITPLPSVSPSAAASPAAAPSASSATQPAPMTIVQAPTVAAPSSPALTTSANRTVAAAPAPAANSYVVQKGDTLWGIAQKHYGEGMRWVDIAKANGLDRPDKIAVGQRLVMP